MPMRQGIDQKQDIRLEAANRATPRLSFDSLPLECAQSA